MLTGLEIKRQVELGGITISPFNVEQLNPNSYDVLLGNQLKVFWGASNFIDLVIPDCGCWIDPQYGYLASIQEWIHTDDFIPCIDGKSTHARSFLQVHQTAGFGDIGFAGQFTLEITTKFPFKLYPGMRIAQVYFDVPVGDISMKYSGKYQNQRGPTPAK